jgi:phytoene dehydrogenase-like protein
MNHDDVDVAVVGAGFGGLATALELASSGRRVALFERLTYPGGCASTFERHGWEFESGATLFAGLDDDQLFGRWIETYDMPVEIESLDPVVEMRTDRFELEIPNSRERFAERLSTLEGVDAPSARRLLARQKRVADALWELFRDPDLLPPFGLRAFWSHVRRVSDYLPILPWIGRTMQRVLAKYGLDDTPLRDYFDAVCQITVQVDAARAEAPFALAATDYFFRGSGHVEGGIGELAEAIADTIDELGGDVHFADPVRSIERGESSRWRVESRRREIEVDGVVSNLLPGATADLLDDDLQHATLDDLSEEVRQGWGAAMLYLGIDPEAPLPESAHHFQLIDDSSEPFMEGNHVFCSLGSSTETDRSPNGERTVTCSTHVDMDRLLEADEGGQADYIDTIHEQMRETLRRRAPELADHVVHEMTASPRTFERFTGRPEGFVGGIPRTSGLHNYRRLTPLRLHRGMYLVGDSVFPGQSTLACAVGGVKVAQSLEGEL